MKRNEKKPLTKRRQLFENIFFTLVTKQTSILTKFYSFFEDTPNKSIYT
jgi:hypothetical protein